MLGVLVVVVLAESYGPPLQSVAPAQGSLVPHNMPAFIGDGDTLNRVELDGGVRALQRIDSYYFGITSFETGPLVIGESFFLGDGGTPVTVTEPALFPRDVGVIAFGDETSDGRWLHREVFVRLSPEADVWRAVSRLDVSARPPFFGSRGTAFGLVDDHPLGVRAGLVGVDCRTSPGRHSVPVTARLQIARGPAAGSRTEVILDCTQQPPAVRLRREHW